MMFEGLNLEASAGDALRSYVIHVPADHPLVVHFHESDQDTYIHFIDPELSLLIYNC
jgi:hypothetical protein